MTDRAKLDEQIRADFAAWCYSHRILGRDRLWQCFHDAWAHGFAFGVDHREEKPPLSRAKIEHPEQHSRAR